jgi:hypothetical protein
MGCHYFLQAHLKEVGMKSFPKFSNDIIHYIYVMFSSTMVGLSKFFIHSGLLELQPQTTTSKPKAGAQWIMGQSAILDFLWVRAQLLSSVNHLQVKIVWKGRQGLKNAYCERDPWFTFLRFLHKWCLMPLVV